MSCIFIGILYIKYDNKNVTRSRITLSQNGEPRIPGVPVVQNNSRVQYTYLYIAFHMFLILQCSENDRETQGFEMQHQATH